MSAQSRFPDFARDEYGKPLHGPNGRLICRGCKEIEVPPKRQTWCSLECKKKYDPHFVHVAVWTRDKGICQRCRRDLWKEYQERHTDRGWAAKIELDRVMRYSGMKESIGVHFDHIVPFSEGGPTVAENMRVLCVPCHKVVTAEWRRKKAKERRGLQELSA